MIAPETAAFEVAAYLRACGYQDCRPVLLKIGRETFGGARYRQLDGCEVIHVSADHLPASRARSRYVAYRLPDDERDWYVSGWALPDVTTDPRYARFHPVGPWWQLRSWTALTPIDDGEERPYRRVSVSVQDCGEEGC